MQLKSEVTWHTKDRNVITFFKANGLRIVLIALHKDAVMQKACHRGNYRFTSA